MTLQNVNLCIIIDRQIPKGRGSRNEKSYGTFVRKKVQSVLDWYVYTYDNTFCNSFCATIRMRTVLLRGAVFACVFFAINKKEKTNN